MITFTVAQMKINKEGENARGQWTAYGIKTTDGSWLSGLSPVVEGLAQLEEGDLVTAETKTDGQYTNIVKILNVKKPSKKEESSKPQPEASMPVKTPPGAPGDREKAIEEAVWFKEAGEGLRSGLITDKTTWGKAVQAAYFVRMFSVLGIKVQEQGK